MDYQPQNKRRPHSVTVAGALQLLVAVAFLIVPAVGLVYGGDVQAAAEAEVVWQGLPADMLDRNDVRFDEHGIAVVLPVVIAVGLAILALLNLAGNRVGRILSWIFQPVLLVVDGLITASQLFTVRLLESAFDSSGDATLQQVDVQALLDAAADAYPDWLPYLTGARFVVTPLASVLVIILLAVPSVNAYFRKDGSWQFIPEARCGRRARPATMRLPWVGSVAGAGGDARLPRLPGTGSGGPPRAPADRMRRRRSTGTSPGFRRYHFTLGELVAGGALRPLRDPNEPAEYELSSPDSVEP